MHEKNILSEGNIKVQFLKKNIRASASFKCILLLSFCVIFVTHVYEIDILRKQKQWQYLRTR